MMDSVLPDSLDRPFGRGEVTARMPTALIADSQDAFDEWHPWPIASERVGWESLAESTRLALLAKAERSEREEWPRLPATLVLEYSRIGNRRHGEDAHFLRRQILRDLVMGACVAGDGRFIEAALDAIWSICEETFWGIPAHSYSRRYPETPLPAEDEPVIDLFAAETAAHLAWAHYLLKDQLTAIAPTVADRIVREIDRRILVPFLKRDDWHWLAVTAKHAANWTPWICSNVIICSLLCETNSTKRISQLGRAVAALDVYVASLPDDGGCSEGQTYWTRGPGALFDCLDVLESASAGRLDGFSIPVVRRLPNYLVGMHLNGRVFVQHSDGHVLHTGDAITIYRFATRVGDTAAEQLARHLRDSPAQLEISGVSLNRTLQDTFTAGWHERPPACAPAVGESWLPDLQVGSAREHPGSPQGLTLVTKAGHNGEDHNHNDVGSFTIALDGIPFVIDPGVGSYTRETFGKNRYDIWTMRSAWHNLPVIGGREQSPGIDRRARDVHWRSGETSGLTAQLADAWSSDAGVLSWQREIYLQRSRSRVVLTDSWVVRPGTPRIELPIVLAGPVEIDANEAIVTVQGVQLAIHPGELAMRSEELVLDDQNLKQIWGEKIYRLILTLERPAPTGSWMIEISRATRQKDSDAAGA
jgi:hypothetical protein